MFRRNLRFIVREPKFSLSAILMLAVGISLAGICYAVLEAAVFNAIPYEAPTRLVEVGRGNGLQDAALWRLTRVDFEKVRGRAKWFEAIGYELDSPGYLTSGATATPVVKATISPRLMDVLRVKPLLGRTFLPEDFEASASGTALLSHALWTRAFAADPGVLGKPVTVDGRVLVVVGVMPKEMRRPVTVAELWVPDQSSEIGAQAEKAGDKIVVARLRGTVSLEQAQRETAAIETDFMPGSGRQGEGDRYRYRLVSLADQFVGKTGRVLNLLLGACLLLQAAACFNVGHLMIARRLRKARDLGIQLALGSGVGRICNSVVFESVAVAFAGIALAVPLMLMALHAAGVVASNIVGVEIQPELSLSVLGFGSVLAAVSSLLCAAAPILVLRRLEVTALIGRRWQAGQLSVSATRLQESLIVLQVAIAVVLVAGLGVLVRSVYHLSTVDLGFEPNRLSYINLDSGRVRFPESAGVQEETVRRLSQLPGVASAAVGSTPLLVGGRVVFSVMVKTAQGWVNTAPAEYQAVSDAYFATLGIAVLRGRPFDRRDTTNGACVGIVNHSFASLYWPGEDAVGKEFDTSGGFGARRTCTVVGVVADARTVALSSPPEPQLYRSFRQTSASANTVVVVRFADKGQLSLAAVRRVVAEVSPTQQADMSTDLGALVRSALLPAGTRATLLLAIAVCALLLAVGGMYAATSYQLSERAGEIGIRMAMGASPVDIASLVYRRYAALGGLGGLLGAVAGVAFSHQAAAGLSGAASGGMDWSVLAVAPLTCALIVFASVAVPTRRAATLNPSDLFRDTRA